MENEEVTVNTQTLNAPTPASTIAQTRRMSFEEFLHWEHEGIAEWVNGEATIMAVVETHQRILHFLMTLLENFVKLYGLGRLLSEPYVMRATPEGAGREPDIMFVATEHFARIEPRYLNGPADLIIEVVSDESVTRDRVDKFDEYEEAGVREYWIIDPRPRRQRADFYMLNRQGRYQPVPVDEDGIYRSTVLPDFWLKVDWLWASNLDHWPALIEIVGMERLIETLKRKQL
jgi:Uma2 family endonuclease